MTAARHGSRATGGDGGPTARRRRRGVAAVLVAVVLVAAGAWWTGSRIRSPSEVAAQAAPPSPSTITAPVRLGRLVDSIVTQGKVAPVGVLAIKVTQPRGATLAVVTATPVGVGGTVVEGTVALEVSGRPVFVLEGQIPMYRDIRGGDAGPDVAELQASLTRLGYSPGDSGTFDRATQSALRELYMAHGYRPVSAGGKNVIAPMAELRFVRSLPALAVERRAHVGTVLTADTIAMTLARSIGVVARVSAAQREEVHLGSPARVDADAFDVRMRGSVSWVASSLSSGSAGGIEGYSMRVRTNHPIPAKLLDKAVRVTIRVGKGGRQVLSVPESAVWTGPDGDTYVTKLEPGGARRDVPVRLGPTASGFVEVVPHAASLEKGDRVVVGRS